MSFAFDKHNQGDISKIPQAKRFWQEKSRHRKNRNQIIALAEVRTVRGGGGVGELMMNTTARQSH